MSRFVELVDVSSLLVAPEVGAAVPRVPKEWEAWDHLYEVARDGANLLLAVIDKLPGVDVPRLPGGTLADLVVKPLSGDWDRIAAHGDAAERWAQGMRGVAANLAVVPAGLGSVWEGEAAVAFRLRHAGFAAAIGLAAELSHTGRLLFEGLGRMSLRLGERVIELLTRLGRVLIRLARKVGQRLAPYVGWALSVKEVLVDGLGPILDIIEDLREVVGLVQDPIELVALIQEWLAEIKTGLHTLLEFGDLLGVSR
jgi:hypothetical protein